MNDLTDTLLSQMMKAREESLRRKIEANAVIIDEEIAVVNGFKVDGLSLSVGMEAKPQVLGLRIKYAAKESLPLSASFVMYKDDFVSVEQKAISAMRKLMSSGYLTVMCGRIMQTSGIDYPLSTDETSAILAYFK